MNYTKDLFNKTISVLVNAYFKDTLEHGNYCGCAVGNILANNVGAELYRKSDGHRELRWRHDNFDGGEWYSERSYERKYSLIKHSDYAWSDLMIIEKAFESVPVPYYYYSTFPTSYNIDHDKWMFNGLMAVVDVLCEIHGMNETEKTEAKAMFVKA